MVITFKNYSLELVSGTNFNLTETIQVEKSKKVNGKLQPSGIISDKVINHGYALPFEKCAIIIINLEISKKEDTLDLRDYIKQYKSLKNEVLNILK